MKWLKSLLLVLSLSVASLGTPLVAKTIQTTQEVKQTTQPTHLFSVGNTSETPTYCDDSLRIRKTIIVEPCVFDTIHLAGRGIKYHGKRYYYTDKECFVVELKAKNKKTAPFDWVATLIKRFLRI